MSTSPTTQPIFPFTGNWTKEQLKLAFHLYCQLPFGKLHQGNPEIIELSKRINRTPSALAMKLVNFASLDPSITGTGRKGLSSASALDREIWNEFHADLGKLVIECEGLLQRAQAGDLDIPPNEIDNELPIEDFTGETRQILVEQREKQAFFRRTVVSGYQFRCCISGLSEPRLLVASHIIPWSKDKSNRLNPSNGLCLSALHDKAFDSGLITISAEYKVVLSSSLSRTKEPFTENAFSKFSGKEIEFPQRFLPSQDFLQFHRESIFKGE